MTLKLLPPPHTPDAFTRRAEDDAAIVAHMSREMDMASDRLAVIRDDDGQAVGIAVMFDIDPRALADMLGRQLRVVE